MTNTVTIDAGRDAPGGYKVDVGRGQSVGRVSSEWFNRPADKRYLSLSDLMASVQDRAERSRTRTVETAAIRVEAMVRGEVSTEAIAQRRTQVHCRTAPEYVPGLEAIPDPGDRYDCRLDRAILTQMNFAREREFLSETERQAGSDVECWINRMGR